MMTTTTMTMMSVDRVVIDSSLIYVFQMATIETIMTAIVDGFPKLRKWKPLVAAAICSVMFLLGLTLCTQVGK